MPDSTPEIADHDDMPVLKVLPDLVRRQLNARPQKTAFIFEGQSLTYAELEQGSNRVANGLLNLGTLPDQRIGFLGKNSHHYFELLLGVAKSGGVLCPINWRLAGAEVAYILNNFTPEILFIGPEFMDMASDLKSMVSSIKQIIAMEADETGTQHYVQWRDGQADEVPKIEAQHSR